VVVHTLTVAQSYLHAPENPSFINNIDLDVHGPFAPDTVFMRARKQPDGRQEFDVVIAMYHDQGLIPVKYLGLEHGVNVTLGLPLLRTSPDHGTAFNIAGKGIARAESMEAAINTALELG
jgi:4-hydroxythreonine-4-phosphate dehydrogenase